MSETDDANRTAACVTLEEDNKRLRSALRDIRLFLSKPEWGTYDYMNEYDVYKDIEKALLTIAVALGDNVTND